MLLGHYWLDDNPIPYDGLEMEREDCLPYCYRAVVLSPIPVNRSCFKQNPVIYALIKIWKQLRNHFKLKAVSFLLPITANPSFTPSALDEAFSTWKQLGICIVGNLYIEGTFASFQQLQARFNSQRNQFFRYLQIRDYARTHLPNFEKIKILFNLFHNPRYIISQLNKILQNIKEEWEREFGALIPPNVWEERRES